MTEIHLNDTSAQMFFFIDFYCEQQKNLQNVIHKCYSCR